MKYIVERKKIEVVRTLVEAESSEDAIDLWNNGYNWPEESTQTVTTVKAELVSTIVPAVNVPVDAIESSKA